MTASGKPSIPLTLHSAVDTAAASSVIDSPPRSRGKRVMRLADFILSHRGAILSEWEEFARTCSPASASMGLVALSDHASEMLTVIAEDLKTPQGAHEQAEKSKGHAPASAVDGMRTAAEKHGTGRAESGFTMEQMVAEYRALRASVIRLWSKEREEVTLEDLDDLTRFNEAIDQSLAESVTRFSGDLDKSKEMFLAILGHDLRNPIGAVMTSAKFMLDTKELVEPHLTLTTRIARAADRMNHMVGALLDFTRSRLGGGIPITRSTINMGKVIHDAVDEISAAHPGRTITIDARDSLFGEWDCARITQVLSNLIINALEHGGERTVVNVTARADSREVAIAIHNRGPEIPQDELDGLFNAMKRQGEGAPGSGPSGNLGLGLYIADQIVAAHKGRIEVESSIDNGTTFTVFLPRAV